MIKIARYQRQACKLLFFLVMVFGAKPLSPVVGASDRNADIQLTVELSDGSRLKGKSVMNQVSLTSAILGKFEISVDNVRTLVFQRDMAVSVRLSNGDSLQGKLGLETWPLSTIFGEVTVPLRAVRRIEMSSAAGRDLTWKALPFPVTCDWPGPKGQRAVLGDEKIVLQGQPIRSEQAFGLPIHLECEFMVEKRAASDGAFVVLLHPVGVADDREPNEAYVFSITYRNPGAYSGRDGVSLKKQQLQQSGKARFESIWGEKPFVVEEGEWVRLSMDVSSNEIRVMINDTISGSVPVDVPWDKIQVDLQSWQPTNTWRVRNVSVR